MTQIRLTSGRDRGHVKDFPFVDAERMLALGQALPVDMNEPDALAYREIETVFIPDPEVPAVLGDVVVPPVLLVDPVPAPIAPEVTKSELPEVRKRTDRKR